MASRRVLVIDDDPDFLDYVSIVLSCNGYAVQTATSVSTGLDQMRAWAPHLVIADVMMSRTLEGGNICREMRADPQLRDIPLILVSAIVNDDDEAVYADIRNAQVDGFMRKPLEPNDLVARVAALLSA